MSNQAHTPTPSKNEVFEQELATFEATKKTHVNWETIDYAREQINLIDQNVAQLQREVDQYQRDVDLLEVVRWKRSGNIIEWIPKELQASITKLTNRRSSISQLIKAYDNMTGITREQRVEIVLHGHVLDGSEPMPELAGGPEQSTQSFDIPKEFTENNEIMKLLQEEGLLTSNKAILMSSDIIRNFNEHKDLFNFVFDTEYDLDTREIKDKQGLIRNYKFLLDVQSKWITKDMREMLTYRYADAIYNDITKMWGIIQRKPDGITGEYEIINMKTGTIDENNQYNEIIRWNTTRSLIDVVRISSMIDDNFELNNHNLVWDAGLVKTLLKNHVIKDTSGKKIQKAELLIVNDETKDNVISQIDARLILLGENNHNEVTSVEAYQELIFLKEYVSLAELDRQAYMETTLREVNHYRKYTEDTASIWGWSKEQIADMSDKDAVDVFSDILRNYRGPAAILAIVAWIFKKPNLAMGLAWVAAFWWAAANAIDGGKNMVKQSLNSDMLDIVRADDITKSLDNENYQSKYRILADVNRKNANEIIDNTGNTLPSIDNDRLFDITNFITSKGIDVKISDNTMTTVADLKKAISEKGGSFTDDTELKKYIQLLKISGLAEADDKTILDLFYEKKDIANRIYEWITMTWESVFDDKINDKFRGKYNTLKDDREERENLIRVRDLIKGKIDIGFINSVENKLNGNEVSLQTRINEVKDLLKEEGYTDISVGIISALETFKVYEDIDKEVRKFEGIWDENVPSLRKKLASIIWVVSSDREEIMDAQLSTDIDREISKLNGLKNGIKDQYKTTEPFLTLIAEIEQLIINLENTQDAIEEEYRNPDALLSNDDVKNNFTDPNGRYQAKLKQVMANDQDSLIRFTNGNVVSEDSLEGISLSYKRLSSYSSALAWITANHSNSLAKSNQIEIIGIRDSFEDNLKTNIKTHIEKALNEKFTKYKEVKDNLDRIITTPDKLSAGLERIEQAEGFLRNQIDYNDFTSRLEQEYSIVEKWLDMLWYTKDTAWNIADTTWVTIKAWIGTLAYATYTDGYFEKLWNRFNQLKANTSDPAKIAEIESTETAINNIRDQYKALQKVDTRNKNTISKAKSIVGSSLNLESSEISLESLFLLTNKKRVELNSAAKSYITDKLKDITTLNDKGKKDAAIENIDKIMWLYPDREDIQEVGKKKKEEILDAKTLAEFTGIKDALKADFKYIKTVMSPLQNKIDDWKVLSSSESTQLTALKELSRLLLELQDGDLTNYETTNINMTDFHKLLEPIDDNLDESVLKYIPETYKVYKENK